MLPRTLLFAVLLLIPSLVQGQGFRAGFARMSITPALPDTWTDADGNSVYQPDKGDTFEDGNGNGTFDAVWLAGFHQNRPAQAVHDSIYVIATVLDDGETRLAVVVLDAIGFFYDDVAEVRARLPAAWGIDHAVIASTHSHEVPDLLGLWGPNYGTSGVDPAYRAFVKDQITAAIGAAVARLQPAAMHAAEIDIPDHELVADTRQPEVIDPGIRLLLFTDPTDSSTLGSILSWANHPETTWSQNLAITPDFPGYFRDAVAHGIRYGDEIVRDGVGGIHLYINGAIGGLMTTHPDMAIEDPFLGEFFGEPTHEKARAVGHRLADAVLTHLNEGTRTVDTSPTLRVFNETIPIPLQNQGLAQAAQAGLIDRALDEDGSMTSEVNLITLGEAWIVTIPGEIYPELINGGIETPAGADFPSEPVEVPPIRAMMQGRVNLIFGLANDEIGYIIPKSEWDVDAPYLYDADTSPYGEVVSPGPDTAPVIHRAVQRLIAQAMPPEARALREALTFHASFDGGHDAAFARGDPRLYTAPSWDDRATALPRLPMTATTFWNEGGGRFGDALSMNNYEAMIFFFKADKNIAYREENWSGTVSFWLRINPDEDLKPGEWSDPIQITPRSWDDASLFVDFTREGPRQFRFAAFADTKVWNPDGENWWEMPDGAMPMIAIADPPFSREAWTHVVMTFDHFNTGTTDGVLTAYLNGQRVGALTGREQTLTWDSAQALIQLGLQYVGDFDDLAFFNRALTEAEVKALFELDGGVASLFP